jgi:hypothetical protein
VRPNADSMEMLGGNSFSSHKEDKARKKLADEVFPTYVDWLNSGSISLLSASRFAIMSSTGTTPVGEVSSG